MIDIENYFEYIEKIQEKCSPEVKKFLGREVLVSKNSDIVISFWKDHANNYLNGLQYIIPEKRLEKKHWYKGFWNYSNPKEFYNKYLDNKELEFTMYSHRFYGKPKLTKPKELKGVDQAFSVDYITKKCRCKCFILGYDVWVQHKDYFSTDMKVDDEDFGAPLEVIAKKYVGESKKKRFLYPDCWGSIVLRDEAWLVIKNLVHRINLGENKIDLTYQICRQQERYHKFKNNELEDTQMMRFWESVIDETRRYLKGKMSYKEEKKKLDVMEEKLTKLLIKEKKVELEINEIEAM